MFAGMDSSSEDDLTSLIAPDVMKCLERCDFFKKLDSLLSPEDPSISPASCNGTFNLSESILVTAGFDITDLSDIFAVLRSKGGCCDCEILYNAVETSRLKSNYWRRQAAGQASQTPHSRSRPI
jgi:hypothetical protein